jgi:hypothetical protein
MGQKGRRKNGNGRRFGIAAALALAGCVPQPAPTAATPPPAAPPLDPILQAVATGAPGAPLTVATPTGAVTVTITADYISAAGQECRAYALAAPGALTQSKLACNGPAGWQTIPPLTQANPGDPP